MTDYYLMLDLPRTASPQEIRAAYLTRMKVLHPDCHSPARVGAPTAADLNLAYWTLRDPGRRADYDSSLVPPRPRRRGAHAARPRSKCVARSGQDWAIKTPKRHRSAYSPRARAAAALVLVALFAGAAGSTIALWWSKGAPANSAPLSMTSDQKAESFRPPLVDEAMASAATVEFEAILRGAGFSGTSIYGRQCFEELAAQPSPALADYCIAFDRIGAEWERALVTDLEATRYFDGRSRRARYDRLLAGLGGGEVRQIVAAEVAVLSDH